MGEEEEEEEEWEEEKEEWEKVDVVCQSLSCMAPCLCSMW